jgi:hypothetical protein
MKYKSCGSYCKISESIMKRLRSQTSRGIGERLMTTNKTEAWTLLDRENQLYIAEDNKDTDGSMDSIKRREPIICTLT